MTVSAQIAIYPLRQERLTPAVEVMGQALRDRGLQAVAGPMSTYVVGEDDMVFAALREGFARASGIGHVVMTVTVSNACPIPD
jgi:uncharacterized protein YqgV (UPF0045/DUF77 family)